MRVTHLPPPRPSLARYVFRVDLRAEIAGALRAMSVWPEHFRRVDETPMAKVLAALPIARTSLFPSLLTLYGDVERCGFYDIPIYRQDICALMKKLWEHEAHRASFRRIAEVDSSRFVGFLNGLMNTVNSAITDAMDLLVFVRETRCLIGERADGTDAQRAEWEATSDDDKQAKRDEFDEKKRFLTHHCTTVNDTLELLHYTSESSSRSFLLDEVRAPSPRLALSPPISLSRSRAPPPHRVPSLRLPRLSPRVERRNLRRCRKAHRDSPSGPREQADRERGCRPEGGEPGPVPLGPKGECFKTYRYISRDSFSQLDSLSLTYFVAPEDDAPHPPRDALALRHRAP